MDIKNIVFATFAMFVTLGLDACATPNAGDSQQLPDDELYRIVVQPDPKDGWAGCDFYHPRQRICLEREDVVFEIRAFLMLTPEKQIARRGGYNLKKEKYRTRFLSGETFTTTVFLFTKSFRDDKFALKFCLSIEGMSFTNTVCGYAESIKKINGGKQEFIRLVVDGLIKRTSLVPWKDKIERWYHFSKNLDETKEPPLMSPPPYKTRRACESTARVLTKIYNKKGNPGQIACREDSIYPTSPASPSSD